MSYIGYEFMYDGTRAALWGYIKLALVNMGWELHDDISANVKVYKSNGESGAEPYGYVWIDVGTSTYIQFAFYQYWNSTSHAGVRIRYPADSAANARITATYLQTSYPALIAGSKDFVIIAGNGLGGAAGQGVIFGHLPVRFDNNITGAQGTAGTAGTITIASSAGMGVGKKIQIAGAEGCDSLSITAAPNATTRIVTALPRNYGTGAKVGAPASVFGCAHMTTTASWYMVSVWGDAGTTVGTYTMAVAPILNPAIGGTLMYNEGKYYLVPFILWNNSSTIPGQVIGSFGENFMYSVVASTVLLDMLMANNDGSFPVPNFTTGVTANTISDSSRSWTVNEHAGKICCITNGYASGIIKRILSNTSDTLTLDSDWPATYYFPNSGSEFKIAEIVYRGNGSLLSSNSYIKITRTDVPS